LFLMLLHISQHLRRQTGQTQASNIYRLGRSAPDLEPDVYVQAGAQIIGDVKIGAQSSVWSGAVIRGDHTQIKIGERSNIQDLAVVHGLPGHPVQIGNGVSVGHHAAIHGCTIGDNCLIGIGAVILDGAVIAPNSIAGAGALVPGGYSGPEGVLLLGAPARVVRLLSAAEIGAIRSNARTYASLARRYQRELEPLPSRNEAVNGADLSGEEIAALRRFLGLGLSHTAAAIPSGE
jgi:carbonic anhydrase/acetyltransferase-like protein (isoleucine patch superfamily)